jgi:hypothetical protein
MKNYNDFALALSEQFLIPTDIFNTDISNLILEDHEDDFFVTEAASLPGNNFVEFVQYIVRFDEGWQCTRLYLNKLHLTQIISFILEYHSSLFTDIELQPVKDVIENREGHFGIPDETGNLNYIEGVFDEEQAFIDVAKTT